MLAEGQSGRFQQNSVGPIVASFTNNQSLRVAQVEGDGDEASRAGLRFLLMSQGATGIAPVQANPTTAAQWLLYNPTGSIATAFIDMIGVTLASGTAGAGGALHVCPCPPKLIPTTIPTVSSANVAVKNANPATGRGSQIICVSGQTLQNAVASDWMPIAQMNPTGTILGQTQIVNYDVKGKLIIPPSCGLALAVISPTGTTPLFSPIGIWREYKADLE